MDGELFTARDVARIVGMTARRLGYWASTGLASPSVERGGRRLYRFADLIAVKAAFELAERGVSLQAVRRNLRALQASLPVPLPEEEGAPGARPAAPPLTRLRVVSDGERLVVVGGDRPFEPLSGQVVMDFVVGALSERAAQVLALPDRGVRGARDERSAWQWFEEARSLEARGAAAAAEEALRQALVADPDFAAAHNNLGRLAHQAGRRGEAREHYLRALAIDPGQPEARANHALLLEESGDARGAVAEWSRALADAPDFADAHFNLGAALHGAPGGHSEAARLRARFHLLRYLELEGEGPWAQAARSLLHDTLDQPRAG